MSPARRPIPQPRSRPHRFRWDGVERGDGHGHLLCRCGSTDAAAIHRDVPAAVLTIDVAALAAGDRDDDQGAAA